MIDVDGDGLTDLLFGHAIDEQFRIFWGKGAVFDDVPQRVPALRMVQLEPSVVDAADIDGNGFVDLVGVSPEQMAFVVVQSDAARRYLAPLRIETGGVPRTVRAADWDSDGNADLIYTVYDTGKVMWRRSAGNGSFDAERDLTGTVAAMDVVVTPAGRVRSLVVVSSGHLRRYSVRPDGRRSAEPDLDVALPNDPINVLRVLSTYNEAHVWNSTRPDRSLRISLTEGTVCTYQPGIAPIQDVGYFDGDNILDVVTTATCTYCTSSYQLRLGAL